MSDERFDRDLTEVLREIAGEEAPMSLRNRLSDITERAPMGRRLWFATPMRLGMVVAAAVAVLALAIVFWPSTDVGPEPTDSPSPSAAPTASAEASAEPSAEPTDAPTPAPSVAPTPTAAPTPVAQWTGLVWSDPVTPSFAVHLYDLVPWGDGYVAVGEVPVGAGLSQAAFLTSPDGLDWTVTHQMDPVGERYPRHLVAHDGTLLAFSPRARDDIEIIVPSRSYSGALIWRSRDGVDWAIVDSLSWEDGWSGARQHVGSLPEGWDITQHDIQTGLIDVASGPSGMVAIGNSFGDDGMGPIILHSTDGQSWTAVGLPAGSDSALLNSVVEHDDRYVVTGAVGVGPDPDTATAAAWSSDDGVTWVRATVEPDEFGHGASTEFGPLWAGDDGLLACRGTRYMTAGGWRFMEEWLSTDGTSWHVAPNLDQSPGCDWSASDGTRIVPLGPRDHASPMPWPGVTGAWTSTDGGEWKSLQLSTTLTDRLERFWVVPDGVIYAGVESFWFGAPTTAP